MKKGFSRVLLWCAIGLINAGIGASTNPEFDETRAFADQQNQQTLTRLKNYRPDTYIENYTDNPSATRHYQGVTQSSTDSLDRATQATLHAGEAKEVTESIHHRPQFEIHPESSMISTGTLVQREAENIVRGITSEYVDCKPKQVCEMTYTTKTCQKAKFNQKMTCTKNLIVNAFPVENSFQNVSAKIQGIPAKNAKRIVLSLDLVQGVVIAHNGSVANLIVESKPPHASCPDVNVEFISITNDYPANKMDASVLEHPSCQNGFKMMLELTSKSGNGKALHLTIKYTMRARQNPIVQESWSNQCDYFTSLQTQGICQLEREECTQNGGTKEINGITVQRACWAKTDYYHCDTGGLVDSCESIPKTCEQSNSVCIKEKNGVCLGYEQTFECPQNQCPPAIDIACNDTQAFCLDGDCIEHEYLPSQDFAQAASALTATADASKQFNTMTIFNGHTEQCSDDISNFRNCCKNSGWGQDIHLANCSDDEKKLGTNRERKLAIYVGRYCDKEVLGVCMQHKESYCVYDSPMAKIIQEQGRAGQLRLSFGKAEKPNCRGITPEELQRINLEKINFTDMYADMNQKITPHDEKIIQEKIEAQMQQMGATP